MQVERIIWRTAPVWLEGSREKCQEFGCGLLPENGNCQIFECKYVLNKYYTKTTIKYSYTM